MGSKEEVVYAFIDSQNLNLGVLKDIHDPKTGKLIYKGWPLDFGKFRLYLKNKFNVSKAYLCIGHVPGNEKLYSYLQEVGYILVFKPTMPFTSPDGKKDRKGNVDAELVLWASALVYDKYDKAIIVSNDGDFHCLHEYLEAENKLLHILVPSPKYSTLLNKFAPRIVKVFELKDQLENTSKT